MAEGGDDAMSTKSNRIAWHYTIGKHAPSIMDDGVIRCATGYVPIGETPVVWFSLRQYWEPTANKGGTRDGVIVTLSARETWQRGGGGWRFGVAATELLPYRDLKRAANICPDTVRGLERAGRKMGADPALWYGSLAPVETSRCIIQMLDIEAGEWRDLEAAPRPKVESITR
jgi:hypothetical protein